MCAFVGVCMYVSVCTHVCGWVRPSVVACVYTFVGVGLLCRQDPKPSFESFQVRLYMSTHVDVENTCQRREHMST